jgi:hypothetical protein
VVTIGRKTSDPNWNEAYQNLLDVGGSHIAARVAGTYGLGYSSPLAISGTGILYPLGLIRLTATDYPCLADERPRLRVRGIIAVNDVAPTGTYTLGLHPVTRPASSGGAGVLTYTLGAAVAGSNGASIVAPAADSMNVVVGQDFDLPADGIYCLGCVTTATVATSSLVHVTAQLQIRNTL